MKLLKTSTHLIKADTMFKCRKSALKVYEHHGWDYHVLVNLKAGESYTWRVSNEVLKGYTHLRDLVDNKRLMKFCLKRAIQYEWLSEHYP
jgi:hypothetical protein